jgi:toxin ParE1/3/4
MIRWTERASSDFAHIHSFIEDDSFDAADRQCDRIMTSVRQLDRFPRSGKRTFAKGLFELAVPGTPYVIRYRLEHDAVVLAAILHGAMHRSR